MSIDLNLGPLRIANPDDDRASSPTSPGTPQNRPPPPPSHSSGDTVTELRGNGFLPQFSNHEEGLNFNPDSYVVQETQPSTYNQVAEQMAQSSLRHRASMQLANQAQQPGSYPDSPQDASYGTRSRNGSGAALRPMSAMYNLPNTSSSSNMSSRGGYRYREEGGYGDTNNIGGVTRSVSRSARGLMGSIPMRQASQTHRQPNTSLPAGYGQDPARRESRRVRATTGSSVNSAGYDGADASYTNSSSMPRTAEEWQEQGAAVTVQKEVNASGQVQTRVVKKGVKDFNFGRTLGEGSYSTVLAATDRQNMKEYAIKVLDKRHIIKEKKVKYVNIERDTLNRLTDHPGIVRLYYTFQDERSLYFVLDLATGGELLGVLKRLGSFDVECTRFYGAEILDSIAYMHTRGIIHRDLKPENVLLDREMHVKITDFGTAKLLPEPKQSSSGRTNEPVGDPTDGAETDRAVSFVGTAEYVSPELLRDKNACKASDLWAFGCIIYQLLAGRPPFKAANEYLTFQKILALDYSFPDGFPELARDLVERLLVLDPAHRLPIEHIKNHRFFEGIPWGKSLWRQKAPRLKAYVPPIEPIKLNGLGAGNGSGTALNNASQVQTKPNRRPQLQNVTELAPPSQLDIEWSPVLTRNNERILKLGNLIVTSGTQPHSPKDKNGEITTPSEKPKFSRFFSGNTGKRKERLVLITSAGRLVVAAAGGNEKKAKVEVDLVAKGTATKINVDPKGLTYWSLDTRDKYYSFEDPRATTSDPAGSKFSSQEWLDAIEQAREVAIAMSMTNSYSGESILNDYAPSSLSSPSESLGGDAAMPMSGPSAGERHHLRHTLRRNTDEESLKGKRRFSKRHSKSGLAAVF